MYGQTIQSYIPYGGIELLFCSVRTKLQLIGRATLIVTHKFQQAIAITTQPLSQNC